MNQRVILIADRVSEHDTSKIGGVGFEKLSDFYFSNLLAAIEIHFECVVLESPTDFIDNIRSYSSDIVLSLWSGENSRSRRALVPSICEAYGIRYVGSDPYTQTICQDKHLTKSFLREFGINTPQGVLIKSQDDIQNIQYLSTPLVIKPNYEGGSIGITKDSLQHSHQDAAEYALNLLDQFSQTILVEEFVPGSEISVVLFGNDTDVEIVDVLELEIGDFDPTTDIYSLEMKKNDDIQKRRIRYLGLSSGQKERLKNLFLCLDKVDVLRIDGRVCENQFVVLELTPDISFEKGCYLSEAFKNKGYTYDLMIKKIIDNVKY